ncbi:hypothetical protein PRZ48_014765 [Zasmidium cellare]|uniref:SnoaL-like domain-containing protein n=1 Tax=Zasmidium cellare TaxID=395010 RepID=A0ABR0DZ79_ZASCE|nr:hypothetical protein PRZ48_014765 [Zasmidium cellare]
MTDKATGAESNVPLKNPGPEVLSPTARLLEKRSLDIVNCINTRTFEVLFKYAAPAFIDSRPLAPGETASHDASDAVGYMRELAVNQPGLRVDVLSTLVDINEEQKWGTVWINILRTGTPDGTKMENVLRFRWRQTRNGWECVKHTERSQYHHFIPQFLLRNFAQDRSQNARNISGRRPRKDGSLRFISTKDGDLSSGPLSRHYGLKYMYRDIYATEQHGLEKKFSYLEGQAAEIIRKAKTTFLQPDATLTLTRTEKDTLRKFLFLMKYRNTSFGSRFDVPTINEYTTADKGKMAGYMRVRGFQTPRAVWLANMHTFLDITIDPRRTWHAEVRR